MKSFEHIYNNLNPSQKKAVDEIEGVVIINAGPGTGKTHLLTTRIANILRITDTKPNNILCLTYTDSASTTMKKKLREVVGQQVSKISIHTFHAFASEIISRHPNLFFGGAEFEPIDELEQTIILQSIFKKLAFADPLSSFHPEKGYVFLRSVVSTIDSLKKAGINSGDLQKVVDFQSQISKQVNSIFEFLRVNITLKSLDYLDGLMDKIEQLPNFNYNDVNPVFDFFGGYKNLLIQEIQQLQDLKQYDPKLAKKKLTEFKKQYYKKGQVITDEALDRYQSLVGVYKSYQNELYKLGKFDFSDMLLEVVKVLKQSGNYLLDELAEQYQYILIDEFQDTNDIQMELIYLIITQTRVENDPNLLVVGDPNQGIYKFQGAVFDNFLNLKKRFTRSTNIDLTDNYRSTQEILDLSFEAISEYEDKSNIVIRLTAQK